MAKTQIIESFITQGKILEQAGTNDAILCRAKYQICSIGEKNRNNRVYEKAVWDKVLADPDISAKLKNKSLFFHAEHPTTTQSNTEKVAGVVTNMELSENKVYAIMEVLDTPYGRIVDTLLRAGCGIGVSTRADGELEEALDEAGGKYQRVIPESYRFVTIDFTADPSTFGSELPLTVERDVTKVIKGGLDDSKLDRDFATVLLETMHSPEAVSLLESIKHDKHHAGCTCKASEKKCASGCPHALEKEVESDGGSSSINEKGGECVRCGATADHLYAEKYCAKCAGKVDSINRELDKDGTGQDAEMNEVIKKVGSKWQVQSHKGKNLGTYGSEAEAKKRLGQVEFFKHKNEKYTTSSDKSGQPANAKAASRDVRRSAARNKIKVTEQEVQTCPKCGDTFNAIRQGSNPHRCKYDYLATEGVMDGMHTGEKAQNFLMDNWDKFIDRDDAVVNLTRIFKIGESDAKKLVDSLEKSKGKISAADGAMSNEKALPSGINPQLDEMSKRLASVTAERNQLVENYGKDAMAFTNQIKELKGQIEKVYGLVRTHEGAIIQKDKDIAALKEQVEKSTEDKRVLETTHKQAVKHIQEKQAAEVKRITEEREQEITKLKESQGRALIKFYVGAKTKSMGLSLPESVLTLLESCKTVDEVDAMVRKSQNALREHLVQSAGVVSEIVIESQSDPNPVLADIRNKVGIALKHFGI